MTLLSKSSNAVCYVSALNLVEFSDLIVLIVLSVGGWKSKFSGVKLAGWLCMPLILTNRPSKVVCTRQRQPLESLSRQAQFNLSLYWLFIQNLFCRNIRTDFPALDGKKNASENSMYLVLLTF